MLPVIFVSCGKNDGDENENVKIRPFDSFIFVGMINGKPGLYKYNTDDSSYSPYWSNPDEKVIDFSYSDNHSSAFFLTANRTGKEGIFPYVKDAKLYVIPDNSSEPKLVLDVGDGLQVFSRWESGIVFRIVINFWDKKVSTFIIQKTIIFNTFGRILQEESRVYDVVKDGYPRLPKTDPGLNSPFGKYSVSFNHENPDSVFLTSNSDKNGYFVTRVDKPVNELSWSDNRKFVIISTLDVSSSNKSIYTNVPNTSSLYIYSIEQKKIIREWKGGGFKNFFTINDFVIFDDGFERNSSIFIYNFKENRIIKHINVKNGCGLRDIPEIKGFGA